MYNFKNLSVMLMLLSLLMITACADETTDEEAAENYPEEPVTFYVNYDAGGATDLAYREMMSIAEEYLGESITIENVPGGAGSVGTAELAEAEPDGYTLGNTSLQPMTMIPHRQTVAYDPINDFDYIAGWGTYLYGIAVQPDTFEDPEEFIEYSIENPGMTYSDPGPGGPTTLGMELLNSELDGSPEWESVGYDGGGEATASLMGNHVDFNVNNPEALRSAIENEEVELLLSLSDRTWDMSPDTPTARELGYDIDMTSWMAIGGPEGLPDYVIETWQEVIQQTLEDPEWIETAESMDLPLEYMPGEEYHQEVEDSYEEYGEIISGLDLDD